MTDINKQIETLKASEKTITQSLDKNLYFQSLFYVKYKLHKHLFITFDQRKINLY
jgi:hypothetical protein